MAPAAMIGGRRGLTLGLSISVAVAVLDQLSKWAILSAFRPPGISATPFQADRVINVLPVLDFELVWNRGISFGVANNNGAFNSLIFGAVAVVVAVVLIRWMTKARGVILLAGLGLVVGGAAGNLIDRLRYGAVVDFVYVHVAAFDWWPAFNLADSAICVGAAALAIDALFGGGEGAKNTP